MNGDDVMYQLASHIRYRSVAGEGLILDQHAADLIVVNTLGERILELLKDKSSLANIADVLLEEYEVSRDTLVADVRDYLAQLENSGVIEKVDK